MTVFDEVTQFLSSFNPGKGEPEYCCKLVIREALLAYQEGHYAVGSIVLAVHEDKVYVFSGRNNLRGGYGAFDHAEARALYLAKRYLEDTLLKRERRVGDEWRHLTEPIPEEVWDRSATPYLNGLSEGLHVWGSIEPCPMCACMMINARVRSSLSLVEDGAPVEHEGYLISGGGAMAIGVKSKQMPLIWQRIIESERILFDKYDHPIIASLAKKMFDESINALLGHVVSRRKQLAETALAQS